MPRKKRLGMRVLLYTSEETVVSRWGFKDSNRTGYLLRKPFPFLPARRYLRWATKIKMLGKDIEKRDCYCLLNIIEELINPERITTYIYAFIPDSTIEKGIPDEIPPERVFIKFIPPEFPPIIAYLDTEKIRIVVDKDVERFLIENVGTPPDKWYT